MFIEENTKPNLTPQKTNKQNQSPECLGPEGRGSCMAHIPSTVLQRRRENKVWKSNRMKTVGGRKENEDLDMLVRV